MNIGIITFFRSENFGANLQALSTYRYLLSQGHNPIMVYYASKKYYSTLMNRKYTSIQLQAHLDFVDKFLPKQTKVCHTSDDVNAALVEYDVNAVIMGSDAIVQHHPFLSRIRKGKRKPFYVEKPVPERMFPNMFWGIGLDKNVKLAYMSVSSQNSAYSFFSKSLKKRMDDAVSRFSYVSVRDCWTQKMFQAINGSVYPHTPDPVFGFNQNAGDLVKTKDEILRKFNLPDKYVLISLMNQSVSEEKLAELNIEFQKLGVECVSLPMPTGTGFKHNFKQSIQEPLDPLDWYCLLKYAYAYIGSNMHPIVVCLHNAVPCYSIDFWGATNFWGKQKKDGSSKVLDVMKTFGVEECHTFISNGICNIDVDSILRNIKEFPVNKVRLKAEEMQKMYNEMMKNILDSFA